MQIRRLPQINVNSSQEEIIKAMKDCDLQRIEHVNWSDFSYKPDVSFRIAHNLDVIFLSYKVVEDNPRAVFVNDFEPVYKDSCVEFFIAPGESLHYYNFEFNCIGTALVAYGDSRVDRIPADTATMDKIIRYPGFKKTPMEIRKSNVGWEMQLVIPAEALFRDNIKDFSGMEMKANFYKCGDEQEKPHYLSWKPIKTENPDFHRPEYFGKIGFAPTVQT